MASRSRAVRLSEDRLEFVRQFADKHDTSVSEVLKGVVDDYNKDGSPAPTRPQNVVRTSFYVDDEDWFALQKRTRREGVSIIDVFNHGIDALRE